MTKQPIHRGEPGPGRSNTRASMASFLGARFVGSAECWMESATAPTPQKGRAESVGMPWPLNHTTNDWMRASHGHFGH